LRVAFLFAPRLHHREGVVVLHVLLLFRVFRRLERLRRQRLRRLRSRCNSSGGRRIRVSCHNTSVSGHACEAVVDAKAGREGGWILGARIGSRENSTSTHATRVRPWGRTRSASARNRWPRRGGGGFLVLLSLLLFGIVRPLDLLRRQISCSHRVYCHNTSVSAHVCDMWVQWCGFERTRNHWCCRPCRGGGRRCWLGPSESAALLLLRRVMQLVMHEGVCRVKREGSVRCLPREGGGGVSAAVAACCVHARGVSHPQLLRGPSWAPTSWPSSREQPRQPS
jgi:hypothetical protein